MPGLIRLCFLAVGLLPVLGLPACGNLERLSEVGSPPALTPTQNPVGPGYRPVSFPMPGPRDAPVTANSLWHPGSRSFLRDQRAAVVGDIVTVLVQIGDSADLKNESSRARTGTESLGTPSLFGLENSMRDKTNMNPASLLSASSSGNSTGAAAIKRNETVVLRVAGVVSQVLPNGNLVVVGTQEVRVNSELRHLQMSGVIRPQDIASDNTVRHDRMAEARISYGGRGQMTDVQTPRYGQQLMEILLPF